MKILLTIFLSVFLISCSKPIIIETYSNSDDDYFYYGNSLERNFYYDLSISDSLILEFESSTKGGFSSVAFLVTNGFYISADNSGQVYSFADTSGKQIGILKHKGEIAITPIIVKSHLIYVVNEYKEKFSTVYFYNYITGKYAQIQNVEANFINEAVIYDDQIIFVTQKGLIISFNPRGDILWERETKHQAFGDPVLYNDLLIFSSPSGDVVLFDLKTKKIRKLLQLTDSFESTPLVIDNILYIGDNFGEFFAIDLQSYGLIWKIELDNKIVAEPSMDKDGNLFCSTLSGFIYKIENYSGRILWAKKAGSIFNTSPLVFNNILLQSDLNKRLLILDKTDGSLVRTINYERRVQTAPMFHNGYIYLGIDRGTIYRYKVSIL